MRCKNCKDKFEPKYLNQKFCMVKDECIKAFNDYAQKQYKKQWPKRKAKIKKELKSKQDHEKDLQKIFNEFIRKRDEGKNCISCNKPLKGKYDAGHYYPAGTYKNIRFDEFNVWGQCVACNRDKHGNLQEYRIGLIKRLGESAVRNLDKQRCIKRHFTIPELLELKEYYKNKIKELCAN